MRYVDEHLQLYYEGVLKPQERRRRGGYICPHSRRKHLVHDKIWQTYLGAYKTLTANKLNCYWLGMTSLVRKLVLECIACESAMTAGT